MTKHLSQIVGVKRLYKNNKNNGDEGETNY